MQCYKVIEEDFYGRKKFEYEYNDVVYGIENAWKKVKNDENSHNASSDIKLLDYNIVGYYYGNPNELDLTWISENDVAFFVIKKGLQKISMNSKNIKSTHILGNILVDFDIINNCDFIEMAKSLKKFIKKNKRVIKTITFINVLNPICKAWIINTCNMYDIEVKFEKNLEKEKVYTYKQK